MVLARGTTAALIVAALVAGCGGRSDRDPAPANTEKPGSQVGGDGEAGETVDASTSTGTSGDGASGGSLSTSASASGEAPLSDPATTTGRSSGTAVPTACDAGLTLCGDSCVDLASDPEHCGACIISCRSGAHCQGGVCQCPPRLTACTTGCVDLLADPLNCGSCGITCNGGQYCMEGVCSCPTGMLLCNGVCVDLLTDLSNCGDCNTVCIGDRVCVNGWCEDATAAQRREAEVADADFSAAGCPLNDLPGQGQPCTGPAVCNYPLEGGTHACACPPGDGETWICEWVPDRTT